MKVTAIPVAKNVAWAMIASSVEGRWRTGVDAIR
jgi:hypothetical protein